MYSLRKTFDVSMGHRLSKHEGKCKNIHGHNIKIMVQVCSETLNDNGMVIDFSEFKKAVETIIDYWDHTYFQNKSDFYQIPEELFKVIKLPEEPTAENLCKYLYSNLRSRLPKNINVSFVRIWENDSSMAQYDEVSR